MNITKNTKIKDLSKADLIVLQRELTKKGFHCWVDGIYGTQTANSFKRWKESLHLGQTDTIGVSSLALLMKPEIEVDWTDMNCKVSKYFTIREVSHNDKSRIVNHPVHRANVLKLAKILDEMREAWGHPLGVTSWYRPWAVERRIGGSGANHPFGFAADIYPISGGNIWAFQKWADKWWGKRGGLGYGAKKGFVHVDLRHYRRWNY